MTEETCIRIPHSGSPELIPVKSYLYDKRIVFLEGDINMDSSLKAIREIMALISISKEPITLVICSNGGSCADGLNLVDIINSSQVPIRTVVMARAYSMAAVIFAVGGKRYITQNSRIMIHEPLTTFDGNVTAFNKMSEQLREMKERINKILAERCHKSLKEINKATEKDTFFTAEEAVAFGIADEVVTSVSDLFGKEN